MFMIDPKLRNEAVATMSSGIGRSLETVQMFSGGKAIDAALRDELLAKCAAGQYVEIEVPMLAYEQKPGETNRNFVRVRDGGMMAFGQSAKGNPFLRDHEQHDSTAVGGRITKSQTVKNGDGDYSIEQTATLTDPSMAARALRGLMSTVSISWRSTDGQVDCSVCGTPVLTDCYHFPGDKVREMSVDGKKSYVRDRKNSTHQVEWIYNNVEHVETSEVPVPAVKNAKIDAIRNSVLMSAGLADDSEPAPLPPPPQPENKNMSEELIKSLNASLDRANKVAELSDAEKAYFRRLSVSEQDGFLAKSAADRSKMFEVVYTAKNGDVYTLADDKRLVAMAKQNDEDKKKFDEALAVEKAKGLQTRAGVELAHLSGTIESRTALLGAVESIENAEHRTAALQALKDLDQVRGKQFVRQGAGGGKKPDPSVGDPNEALEALAQEIADKNPELSMEQAYDRAVSSPKGQKLYAQSHEDYKASQN